MEGILFTICNPLLDISAAVKPEVLQKYDLLPSNAILAEPKHLPLYQELVDNYPVEYIAGGAGQNTARAAQWMLQIPKATIYVGCVGKDIFGQILCEEATSDGVTVKYLEDETTPTGTCAVLITDKDRSLIANLGAANCYKKYHFDSEEIQKYVNQAKYFYATGFFLTVSPETLVAIGQHVVNHNKYFLTNLSAPFLLEYFFDKFLMVLPYVDVIFGNEHEFAALIKKQQWPNDLKEAARRLSEMEKINKNRPRMVIVTQGGNPTIVFNEGQIKEYPVEKIPPEELVDTNGAGDSFVGGFLAAFVQGKSVERSLAAGHYCARVTLGTSGTVFKGKTRNFQF